MSELRINKRTGLLLMTTTAIAVIGLLLIRFGDHFWPPVATDWQLYKSLFLNEQGRIIDSGNNNVSHSEGQGWGMLFAVNNNDQETFEKLWEWTKSELQIRQDHLFAWRWEPVAEGNEAVHVKDLNNASDGDLYIAWALQRAGEKWNRPDFTTEALNILQDVRQSLIRNYANKTVLLPGIQGFERDDHLLLNLSYWVFPAFDEFIRIDPDPVWKQLRDSGIKLIEQARFGQWQLPSDWIELTATGTISLTSDFPPRFSYDAIRVPLVLLWGDITNPDLLKPYQSLVDHMQSIESKPAWVNLQDNSFAPYQASDGINGIISLASATYADKQASDLPRVKPDQDYYSASLVMLTRQAVTERKNQ